MVVFLPGERVMKRTKTGSAFFVGYYCGSVRLLDGRIMAIGQIGKEGEIFIGEEKDFKRFEASNVRDGDVLIVESTRPAQVVAPTSYDSKFNNMGD